MPALLLLGERGALRDAAGVETVPGAGHALPTDQLGLVTERVLKMAGRRAYARTRPGPDRGRVPRSGPGRWCGEDPAVPGVRQTETP